MHKNIISNLSQQKQGNGKQLWLITYGSSSESITHDMFKQCGLEVEECYTATWRESKYTLIKVHKANRPRKTGMQKIMCRMIQKFRVIETEIFGFDSVSYNSKAEQTSLEDHPGFKLIVQNANKTPVTDLERWIHKGVQDLAANRKGLLWRHIEITDAKSMTRSRLIQRVEMLTARVRELEQEVRDERAFNDTMLIQFASGNRPVQSQQPSMQ
jgi:hypothetical protein